MSAKDHRNIGHESNGIGFRIKEWMIWTEKRTPATHNLSRVITHADLAKHSSKNDLWLAIDGTVYDATLFSMYHPGGKELLVRAAGTDCSAQYNRYHAWVDHRTILRGYIVGVLPADANGQAPPALQPGTNSSSATTAAVSIDLDERTLLDTAMGCGLFRGSTELQREAMAVPAQAQQQQSTEEDQLGALFDELDTQRTGYVLRSQVEQLITALNEGQAMDPVTLQRLQSMRSELINRRQFILLFL
eukprot:PhM_4_TR11037/c0_g2_i1/m.31460